MLFHENFSHEALLTDDLKMLVFSRQKGQGFYNFYVVRIRIAFYRKRHIVFQIHTALRIAAQKIFHPQIDKLLIALIRHFADT